MTERSGGLGVVLAVLPLLVVTGGVAEAGQGAAASDGPAVTVGLDARSERFDYRFANESNIEAGPLVPHEFEQKYDASAVWLVGVVRYRLFHASASTEAGLTPRLTRTGSDIDTFYQPSGDVITSGTRGDVRLRSWALRQRFDLAWWRSAAFGVTLGYRQARADFLPGDRIVTHSRPTSESRAPVPGHETTWSRVFDSGLTARVEPASRGAWRVSAGADLLPLVRARLSISLPDKYPGERIYADARAFGAGGFVSVGRQAGGLVLGGRVEAGGAWGYRRKAHYHERSVGAEVFARIGG